MKLDVPKVGLRTIKTAVAVVVCYLIFLPFWTHGPGTSDSLLRHVAPVNACVAAVICMQSSIEQSLYQGISRIVGTILGGLVGLLALLLDDWIKTPLVTGVLLGGAIVLTLWLCNLIKRPAACAIGCVVVCVIILTHGGSERYFYIIFRVLESIAGIAVALAVNRILPNHHKDEAP